MADLHPATRSKQLEAADGQAQIPALPVVRDAAVPWPRLARSVGPRVLRELGSSLRPQPRRQRDRIGPHPPVSQARRREREGHAESIARLRSDTAMKDRLSARPPPIAEQPIPIEARKHAA